MRPCSSKSSLRRAAAASGERRPLLRRAGSVVPTLVLVVALVVVVLALVVRLFLGDRDVILPIGGESEGYRGRGPGRRRSMAVPQRLDRCRGARGERRRSDEERDQHDLGLQELLHDRSFRRVL